MQQYILSRLPEVRVNLIFQVDLLQSDSYVLGQEALSVYSFESVRKHLNNFLILLTT